MNYEPSKSFVDSVVSIMENIELNPAHKGAFHRWLGKPESEHITREDIQKGLDSDDSHVREMANFAKNEKNWNHA